MGYIKVLVVLILATVFVGCSSKLTTAPVSQQNAAPTERVATVPPIITQKKSQPRILDPLDGKMFTFSASNVPAETVFYVIAQDAGLNLVVDRDVSSEDTISANFINTPVKDVLAILMDMTDLFYEVRGNVLRIHKYKTVNFNIPYLATLGSHEVELGGDVIDNMGEDVDTGIKGEFKYELKKEEESTDYFKQVEENIEALLGGDADSAVTLNRIAAIASVRTTNSKMRQIEKLLANIVENSVRQVQIEAKIVEVILKDSNSLGISWSYLFRKGSLAVSGSGLVENTVGSFFWKLTDDIDTTLNAVSIYGTIDMLSNPRITVLNNQSAILTAGTVRPYWEITVETSKQEGLLVREVEYKRTNVLEGVVLGLTAFVHDDNTVLLNIVPIVTSVLDEITILDENKLVIATAPVLDIKEIGTTVQVEDGEMLILGGLVSNKNKKEKRGLPVLSHIPVFGYLFGTTESVVEKRELVVFVKPTVVYSKTKLGIR